MGKVEDEVAFAFRVLKYCELSVKTSAEPSLPATEPNPETRPEV